jgi:hypothetical protein
MSDSVPLHEYIFFFHKSKPHSMKHWWWDTSIRKVLLHIYTHLGSMDSAPWLFLDAIKLLRGQWTFHIDNDGSAIYHCRLGQ